MDTSRVNPLESIMSLSKVDLQLVERDEKREAGEYTCDKNVRRRAAKDSSII